MVTDQDLLRYVQENYKKKNKLKIDNKYYLNAKCLLSSQKHKYSIGIMFI